MYSTSKLFKFRKTVILQINERPITCFTKGMAIDADGYPFAYHPENKGHDDLKHGGYSGNWWGVATHDETTGGEPIIQKENDPAPGYYLSTTSLIDKTFAYNDYRRYANAATVPYFVLPDKFKDTISLGDVAWIYNLENGRSAYAIFADVGPDVGEGSMHLAGKLGIDNDPRYGGVSKGILYFIFDGSGKGNGFLPDEVEIEQLGVSYMKNIEPADLLKIFLRH